MLVNRTNNPSALTRSTMNVIVTLNFDAVRLAASTRLAPLRQAQWRWESRPYPRKDYPQHCVLVRIRGEKNANAEVRSSQKTTGRRERSQPIEGGRSQPRFRLRSNSIRSWNPPITRRSHSSRTLDLVSCITKLISMACNNLMCEFSDVVH